MASVEECETAFQALADRLAGADATAHRHATIDRSLSCRLRDLDIAFGARLHDGQLKEIRRMDVAAARQAQVKLTMTSDVLMQLVAGDVNFASAWASGRVKIDARVLDLLKLRSIF